MLNVGATFFNFFRKYWINFFSKCWNNIFQLFHKMLDNYFSTFLGNVGLLLHQQPTVSDKLWRGAWWPISTSNTVADPSSASWGW
jgi:hypothetical protein